MGKLSFTLFLVVAPTLMGIAVLVILTVPSLAENEMKLILPVAVIAAVVSVPISIFGAKFLSEKFGGKS